MDDNKKPSPEVRASEKGQELNMVSAVRSRLTKPLVGGKVDFYEKKGVLLTAYGGTFGSGNHERAKRGIIKGWSLASRKRMRLFMLQNTLPDDWSVCGCTFTIPGPQLTDHQEKALWTDWANRANIDGWSVIWRLEVQERGARHWHAIVGTPPNLKHSAVYIRESWHDALTRLGSFDYRSIGGYRGKNNDWPNTIYAISSLMSLYGAVERSASVDKNAEGIRGSWLRYLQDHASKSKQGQLAIEKGRQWGIVGRRHFVAKSGSEAREFTDPQQWSRFLRAYQRLCTPSFQAECVFGKRLGYRIKRGGRGRSVWFSKPETVKRLVKWALSTPKED